jgi:hypothetical protein
MWDLTWISDVDDVLDGVGKYTWIESQNLGGKRDFTAELPQKYWPELNL